MLQERMELFRRDCKMVKMVHKDGTVKDAQTVGKGMDQMYVYFVGHLIQAHMMHVIYAYRHTILYVHAACL